MKKIKNKKNEAKKYQVFNKLCLFTVESYLQSAMNDGFTDEDFHREILGAIRGYKVFGKFSPKQSKLAQELAKDETLIKITSTEISYVVYALEVLRLWVEMVDKKHRPYLNISDQRLAGGRAVFVKLMLIVKKQDLKKHEELSEIIKNTCLSAKHYVHYIHTKLVEGKM